MQFKKAISEDLPKTKVLVEKGYSKEDLVKILGSNFLRVLEANELKK